MQMRARRRLFWRRVDVILAWRAVSSAVEHCFHTAGVTGSIPVPPTTLKQAVFDIFAHPQLETPYGPPTTAACLLWSKPDGGSDPCCSRLCRRSQLPSIL